MTYLTHSRLTQKAIDWVETLVNILIDRQVNAGFSRGLDLREIE